VVSELDVPQQNCDDDAVFPLRVMTPFKVAVVEVTPVALVVVTVGVEVGVTVVTFEV